MSRGCRSCFRLAQIDGLRPREPKAPARISQALIRGSLASLRSAGSRNRSTRLAVISQIALPQVGELGGRPRIAGRGQRNSGRQIMKARLRGRQGLILRSRCAAVLASKTRAFRSRGADGRGP